LRVGIKLTFGSKGSLGQRRRWAQAEYDESDADIDRELYLPTTLEHLERALSRVRPFLEVVKTATTSDFRMIEPPIEGARAWLHLLMALVLGSNDFTAFERHITRCDELLTETVRKIVKDMIPKSLVHSLVVAPMDLALLLNFRLLQDITKALPNICESYWEYLRGLESKIEADPLDRDHQNNMTLLKYEISIVQETLAQQQQNLWSLSPGLLSTPIKHDGGITYTSRFHSPPNIIAQIDERSQPELSPIDPDGLQGMLVQDSGAHLDKRLREFEEMHYRISQLERWVRVPHIFPQAICFLPLHAC
jgi:hypothetical protein